MDRKALRELLTELNTLTYELIDSLKERNTDNLEELFSKRECIIEKLKKATFKKEELLAEASELKLVELEQELNILYLKTKEDIRKEMQDNKDKMTANMNYINNARRKINFLDEKI